MKIAQFSSVGRPDQVIECIDVNDLGLPKDNEVLIDILAFPINPADVLILEDPLIIQPMAIESIKRFLNDGGSILWFAGENYKNINEQITSNLLLPNYKDQITRYFQKNYNDGNRPIYKHSKKGNIFLCKLYYKDKLIITGEGMSKKKSEQDVSKKALIYFHVLT